MVQDVVRWVFMQSLCITGVAGGPPKMEDSRIIVRESIKHTAICCPHRSHRFPARRWLGLNGHVLWSQPGAVQQLAAEAPRSSTIYQVGLRNEERLGIGRQWGRQS